MIISPDMEKKKKKKSVESVCVCVCGHFSAIRVQVAGSSHHSWDRYIPMSIFIILSLPDAIFFFFNSSFISALETVDADKVYVLGGLVDESIQKVLHNKTEGHSATNRLVQSD